NRQVDCKDRSTAGLALDRNRSAVRLDDGLHEAQAEPEAALGAAGAAAEQTIPDARQLIGGDAAAGVADVKSRAIAGAIDTDLDAAAGRRVLHSVVDEVGGHLLEPRAIGRHDDVMADVRIWPGV